MACCHSLIFNITTFLDHFSNKKFNLLDRYYIKEFSITYYWFSMCHALLIIVQNYFMSREKPFLLREMEFFKYYHHNKVQNTVHTRGMCMRPLLTRRLLASL